MQELLEEPSLPEIVSTEPKKKMFSGLFSRPKKEKPVKEMKKDKAEPVKKSEEKTDAPDALFSYDMPQAKTRSNALEKKEKLLKNLAMAISTKKNKLDALETTLTKKFGELEEKKSSLENKERALLKAAKGTSATMIKLEKKKEQLEKEVSELEEARSRYKEEIRKGDLLDRKKVEIQNYMEELKKTKEDIIKRKKEMKEAEKRLTDMNYVQLTVQKDINMNEREKEALQHDLIELKNQLNMETGKLENLKSELEQHRIQLGNEKQMLFAKEKDIVEKIGTYENDARIFKEREEEVLDAVTKMEHEAEALKHEENLLNQKIHEFKKEKMDHEAQVEWMNKEKEKLENNLGVKIKALQKEIEKAKKYNAKIVRTKEYREHATTLENKVKKQREDARKLTAKLAKLRKDTLVQEKIMQNLIQKVEEKELKLSALKEQEPRPVLPKRKAEEKKDIVVGPVLAEPEKAPVEEHFSEMPAIPSFEEIKMMAHQTFPQTEVPAQHAPPPSAAPEPVPQMMLDDGGLLLQTHPTSPKTHFDETDRHFPEQKQAETFPKDYFKDEIPEHKMPELIRSEPKQAPPEFRYHIKEEIEKAKQPPATQKKRGFFARTFIGPSKEEKLKRIFMKKAMKKVSKRYPEMDEAQRQSKCDGLWQKYQTMQAEAN